MIDISSKIKNLRIKNNLTQQEFGDKLFVSDKTVSSWESKRTLPDINMLMEICDKFNTNLFSLLNDTFDNNTEIELKIKVDNNEYNRILNMIKENSVLTFSGTQSATYYKPSNKEMINEWFRVRNENNTCILNYKRKKDESIVKEYEVTIDNEKNFKTILSYLGFTEVVNVSKNRISYLYKEKYEFSFDNVSKLGLFIEIEIKKYDYNIEEEFKKLFELLNEFNIDINKIEVKRYPELMLELNKL